MTREKTSHLNEGGNKQDSSIDPRILFNPSQTLNLSRKPPANLNEDSEDINEVGDSNRKMIRREVNASLDSKE